MSSTWGRADQQTSHDSNRVWGVLFCAQIGREIGLREVISIHRTMRRQFAPFVVIHKCPHPANQWQRAVGRRNAASRGPHASRAQTDFAHQARCESPKRTKVERTGDRGREVPQPLERSQAWRAVAALGCIEFSSLSTVRSLLRGNFLASLFSFALPCCQSGCKLRVQSRLSVAIQTALFCHRPILHMPTPWNLLGRCAAVDSL